MILPRQAPEKLKSREITQTKSDHAFSRCKVGFAGANCAMVPADVFESLHPKAQPLYSHRVPVRVRVHALP